MSRHNAGLCLVAVVVLVAACVLGTSAQSSVSCSSPAPFSSSMPNEAYSGDTISCIISSSFDIEPSDFVISTNAGVNAGISNAQNTGTNVVTFDVTAAAGVVDDMISVTESGSNIAQSPVSVLIYNRPDATSTFECTPRSSPLNDPNQRRSMQVSDCIIQPMLAGVSVRVAPADYDVSITQGNGLVSSTSTDDDGLTIEFVHTAGSPGTEILAVEFTFNGPGDISGSPISFSVVDVPGPDSKLTCTSDLDPDNIIRHSGTGHCVLEVFNNDPMPVRAMAAAEDFSFSGISPAPTLETEDGGSTYTFDFVAPSSGTSMNIIGLANTGSGFVTIDASDASLLLAGTPDSTSSVSCTGNLGTIAGVPVVRRDTLESLSCSITPRASGNPVRAVIADFVIEPTTGSIDQFFAISGGTSFSFVFTPGSAFVGTDTLVISTEVDDGPKELLVNQDVIVAGIPSSKSLISCTTALGELDGLPAIRLSSVQTCNIEVRDENDDPTIGVKADFFFSPSGISAEQGTIETPTTSDSGANWSFSYRAPSTFGTNGDGSADVDDVISGAVNVDGSGAVPLDNDLPVVLIGFPTTASILTCTNGGTLSDGSQLRRTDTATCSIEVHNDAGPATGVPVDFVISTENDGVIDNIVATNGGAFVEFTFDAGATDASDQINVVLLSDGGLVGQSVFFIVDTPTSASTVDCEAPDVTAVRLGSQTTTCTIHPENGDGPIRGAPEDFVMASDTGSFQSATVVDGGTSLVYTFDAPTSGLEVTFDASLASDGTNLSGESPITYDLVGTPSNDSPLVCANTNGLVPSTSVRYSDPIECRVSVVDDGGMPIKALMSDFTISPSSEVSNAHFESTDLVFDVASPDTGLTFQVSVQVSSAEVTDSPFVLHMVGNPVAADASVTCASSNVGNENMVRYGEVAVCTLLVTDDNSLKAVSSDFSVSTDYGVVPASMDSADNGLTFTFEYTAPAAPGTNALEEAAVTVAVGGETIGDGNPVTLYLVGLPTAAGSSLDCTSELVKNDPADNLPVRELTTTTCTLTPDTRTFGETYLVSANLGLANNVAVADNGASITFDYSAPGPGAHSNADFVSVFVASDAVGSSPFDIFVVNVPSDQSTFSCVSALAEPELILYDSTDTVCTIEVIDGTGSAGAALAVDFNPTVTVGTGSFGGLVTVDGGQTFTFAFNAPSTGTSLFLQAVTTLDPAVVLSGSHNAQLVDQADETSTVSCNFDSLGDLDAAELGSTYTCTITVRKNNVEPTRTPPSAFAVSATEGTVGDLSGADLTSFDFEYTVAADAPANDLLTVVLTDDDGDDSNNVVIGEFELYITGPPDTNSVMTCTNAVRNSPLSTLYASSDTMCTVQPMRTDGTGSVVPVFAPISAFSYVGTPGVAIVDGINGDTGLIEFTYYAPQLSGGALSATIQTEISGQGPIMSPTTIQLVALPDATTSTLSCDNGPLDPANAVRTGDSISCALQTRNTAGTLIPVYADDIDVPAATFGDAGFGPVVPAASGAFFQWEFDYVAPAVGSSDLGTDTVTIDLLDTEPGDAPATVAGADVVVLGIPDETSIFGCFPDPLGADVVRLNSVTMCDVEGVSASVGGPVPTVTSDFDLTADFGAISFTTAVTDIHLVEYVAPATFPAGNQVSLVAELSDDVAALVGGPAPTEACNIPSYGCWQVTPATCTSLGGTPTGADVCPGVLGACDQEDGDVPGCVLTEESACQPALGAASVDFSAGVECELGSCSGDGSCVLVSSFECELSDDAFGGESSSCDFEAAIGTFDFPVIGSPDATSVLTCTGFIEEGYARSGALLSCSVAVNEAESATRGLQGDFAAVGGGGLVSGLDAPLSVVDTTMSFNYAASPAGSPGPFDDTLSVAISPTATSLADSGSSIDGGDLEFVVVGDDSDSFSVSCETDLASEDFGTRAGSTTTVCTLSASSPSESAAPSDFTVSAAEGVTSSLSQGDEPNEYTFTYEAPGTGDADTITVLGSSGSDITGSPVGLVVYGTPAASESSLACNFDFARYDSGSVTCTITAESADGTPILALASDFEVSVSGATLVGSGGGATFDFVYNAPASGESAPTSESISATIESVDMVDSPVSINLVGSPDTTSTIECPTTPVREGTDVTCTLTPMQGDAGVRALAGDFSISAVGTVEVAELPGADPFAFEITYSVPDGATSDNINVAVVWDGTNAAITGSPAMLDVRGTPGAESSLSCATTRDWDSVAYLEKVDCTISPADEDGPTTGLDASDFEITIVDDVGIVSMGVEDVSGDGSSFQFEYTAPAEDGIATEVTIIVTALGDPFLVETTLNIVGIPTETGTSVVCQTDNSPTNAVRVGEVATCILSPGNDFGDIHIEDNLFTVSSGGVGSLDTPISPNSDGDSFEFMFTAPSDTSAADSVVTITADFGGDVSVDAEVIIAGIPGPDSTISCDSGLDPAVAVRYGQDDTVCTVVPIMDGVGIFALAADLRVDVGDSAGGLAGSLTWVEESMAFEVVYEAPERAFADASGWTGTTLTLTVIDTLAGGTETPANEAVELYFVDYPTAAAVVVCDSGLVPATSMYYGSTDTVCTITSQDDDGPIRAVAADYAVAYDYGSVSSAAGLVTTDNGANFEFVIEATAVTVAADPDFDVEYVTVSVNDGPAAGATLGDAALTMDLVRMATADSVLSCVSALHDAADPDPIAYVRYDSADTACTITVFGDDEGGNSVASKGVIADIALIGTVGPVTTPDSGYTFEFNYEAPSTSSGLDTDSVSAGTAAASLGFVDSPAAFSLVHFPSGTDSTLACASVLTPSTDVRWESDDTTCTITVAETETGGPGRAVRGDFAVSVPLGSISDLTTADGGAHFTFVYTAPRGTYGQFTLEASVARGPASDEIVGLAFDFDLVAFLVFADAPSDVVSLTNFEPLIRANYLTSDHAVDTDATQVVTASLISVADGSDVSDRLVGDTAIPLAAGEAIFGDLQVTLVGDYMLAVQDGESVITSESFTVSHGDLDHITYQTAPGGALGGSVWDDQPVIELRDAAGNLRTSDSSTVLVLHAREVDVTDAPDALRSTAVEEGDPVSATAVNGVVTFDSLYINKVGDYVIEVMVDEAELDSSATITVELGPPAGLEFKVQPGGEPTTGGLPFATQPQVAVVDAGSNVQVGDFVSVITLELEAGDGTLSGSSLSVTVMAGKATFSGVSIDLIGADKVLFAGSAPASGDPYVFTTLSEVFEVALGPTADIVVSAVDAVYESRDPISFTATLVDAGGNTNTVFNEAVPVALSGGSADATLTGDASPVADAGVATFALDVDKVGDDYLLTVGPADAFYADTTTFTVVHGPATHLVFGEQPGAAGETVGGELLTTQPTVIRLDIGDNVVTSDSSTVISLTLVPDDLSSLSGTTAVTVSSGVATFTDLMVDFAGIFTLEANDGDFVATSDEFEIINTPPSPPRDLYAYSIAPTTMSWAWTEPLVSGGFPVETYHVVLAAEGVVVYDDFLPATQLSIVFNDLERGTVYGALVSATNEVGEGDPHTEVFEITDFLEGIVSMDGNQVNADRPVRLSANVNRLELTYVYEWYSLPSGGVIPSQAVVDDDTQVYMIRAHGLASGTYTVGTTVTATAYGSDWTLDATYTFTVNAFDNVGLFVVDDELPPFEAGVTFAVSAFADADAPLEYQIVYRTNPTARDTIVMPFAPSPFPMVQLPLGQIYPYVYARDSAGSVTPAVPLTTTGMMTGTVSVNALFTRHDTIDAIERLVDAVEGPEDHDELVAALGSLRNFQFAVLDLDERAQVSAIVTKAANAITVGEGDEIDPDTAVALANAFGLLSNLHLVPITLPGLYGPEVDQAVLELMAAVVAAVDTSDVGANSQVLALIQEVANTASIIRMQRLGAPSSFAADLIDDLVALGVEAVISATMDGGPYMAFDTQLTTMFAFPVFAAGGGTFHADGVILVLPPSINELTGPNPVVAITVTNVDTFTESADNIADDTTYTPIITIDIYDPSGERIDISGLSEDIMITLPLSRAIPAGQDVSVRFNTGDGMGWIKIDPDDIYEVSGGTITILVDHLTDWVVTSDSDACDAVNCMVDFGVNCDACVASACCGFARPDFVCLPGTVLGPAGGATADVWQYSSCEVPDEYDVPCMPEDEP